jgi:putative ABC transport system permease protein
VFEDIKRLGADNQYRMELLKKQVGKVYILPTVVGVLLALGYEVLLTYGNDGRIVQSEIWTGAFSVLCGVVVVGFQYIMYRKSVRKVKELLKIG